MTSKERAFLRSQGQLLEPSVQVGKDGVIPETAVNTDEALAAHELIKVNVQRTCLTPVREIADTIAARTHSEVVQVIGRKFVLYRYNGKLKKHVPLREE